jgi:hypothetical protein
MRRSASDGARGSGAALGIACEWPPPGTCTTPCRPIAAPTCGRRNLERLAELEARGAERRARLARAAHVAGVPLPAPWLAPRARPA